jgi:hypothetical protein
MTHPASRIPHPVDTALLAALDDAIAGLQQAIFDEGWREIRTAVASNEEALRESVALYERGLAQLFGFLRATGMPADPVAWSTLKAELRRAARDAGITLRTALESGLYAAEAIPLSDHALYAAWAMALAAFLASLAAGKESPAPTAAQDERLRWAYAILAPLEEHAAFHTAFTGYLSEPGRAPAIGELTGRSVDDIVAHDACLLNLPRYDLALNAALRWLAHAEP